MNTLTAYFDEGARLAVELGNARSSARRGAPVRSESDPDPRLDALQRSIRLILETDHLTDAATALNVLLQSSAAAPVLEPDADGRWHLHLHTPHADALSRATVKAATGLATLLDDDAWHVIKRCAADQCDDFFLDRSRNNSARFCSRTCANRVNARLHRQRS